MSSVSLILICLLRIALECLADESEAKWGKFLSSVLRPGVTTVIKKLTVCLTYDTDRHSGILSGFFRTVG